MSQFWFDRLDGLALAGQPIINGFRSSDADFFSRAPAVQFLSNRTTNSTSTFVLPNISAGTVEVAASIRILRQGGDSFTNSGVGIFARYANELDNVFFTLPALLSTTSIPGFYRSVNGTLTAATASNITLPFARVLWQTFWIRIRLNGSQAQWAMWLDGAEPPALSSAITLDLTGAPTSGAVGFRGRSYGSIHEIIAVSVGTDGDSAPLSPPVRSISGTVTDDSGFPAERTVRLYSRSTGVLLNATTSAGNGNYTLSTSHTEEVQVVALDDDAGAVYNDLIIRTTPI